MANKSFSIWSNEILIVQGGSGGGCHPPLNFFLCFFFLDCKTSALDVFNSCSFVARTHFETSLVMVSY